ncbi:hypothetical protein L3Q82_014571, partial [Scortum barcoo]
MGFSACFTRSGQAPVRTAGPGRRRTLRLISSARPPSTTAAVMPGLDHGDFPDVSRVPPCYHDLCDVFTRLYSISGPKRKAMDKEIEALLRSGIIRPSSSPAGAGFFFFFGQKDGSLRPCINYSALNEITVKKQVLTQLLENHLYVKAEKCEFHASSVSFLGFIISPNQVKMDPEKFKWGPKAEEAFQCLKRLFTTAPVLTMPDPSLQFIVEVDASNEGVGPCYLSIHPCAFLSCKLSPVEWSATM